MKSLTTYLPQYLSSSFRLLLRIAFIVSACEISVHFLVEYLNFQSALVGGFVDAFLSVVICALPLWFFIIKPLRMGQTKFYSTILEGMTEGFVIQNQQGAIISFNLAAAKILGLSSDQLMGRTSMDPRWKAVKQDGTEFQGNEHPAMQVLRSGNPCLNVTMGVHRPDNGFVWININSVPIQIDGSKEMHALTTFADVTQREMKRQKLEQSQRELQTAQSLGQIGSWSFELATGKISWTEQMYKIFPEDIKKGEPSFERHRSTIHPEDVQMWEGIVSECAKSGRPYVMRFRCIHPDKEVWVEARGEGIRNSKGEIIGLSGSCQDISERVRMESQLEAERSKTAQAAKLSSLGEMAAGVAHEINNPLAIIAGTASTLERYKDNAEQFAVKVASIHKSVDRISKIINGLRKFARVNEARTHQWRLVTKIVEESLILTNHKALKHGVTIQFQKDSNPEIFCDEIEIEQVLVNLINNGIDAVSNLEEKWVHISVHEDQDWVKISVVDSGAGVPTDVQSKIFNPFFTTKKVGEGTGLGLSICRGIMDQHQATIEIDGANHNTCFVLSFSKQVMDERAA